VLNPSDERRRWLCGHARNAGARSAREWVGRGPRLGPPDRARSCASVPPVGPRRKADRGRRGRPSGLNTVGTPHLVAGPFFSACSHPPGSPTNGASRARLPSWAPIAPPRGPTPKRPSSAPWRRRGGPRSPAPRPYSSNGKRPGCGSSDGGFPGARPGPRLRAARQTDGARDRQPGPAEAVEEVEHDGRRAAARRTFLGGGDGRGGGPRVLLGTDRGPGEGDVWHHAPRVTGDR